MRTWGGAALVALAVVLAAGCGRVAVRPGEGLAAPGIDEDAALETMPATDIGTSQTFHFAWPDGLVGRCRSRRRVAGAGRAEPEREVTFRVRVARGPDEVRIVTDDLAGAAERVVGEDAPGPLVEIVEPDGRYREARGVRDAVAAMSAPEARDPAAAARAVAEIEGQLAQAWKLLVGAWADRELPLGAAYAAAAPETLPGGGTVAVRIVIQADGRVPCRRGESARRCVRVRLQSQPEERAPEPLVPAVLAVLAPELSRPDALFIPEVASIATSAIVVTEPETLIPYRFVLRRHFALRGVTPDDAAFARERAEEITRACAWRR